MLGNQLDQAPTVFVPHSKRRKHGKEECAVKVWDSLDTRTGMSRSRKIAVEPTKEISQILYKHCSSGHKESKVHEETKTRGT